jgi:hypothetical protein
MASVSTLPQERWAAYKAQLKGQLNQIEIPVDANPATVRVILARLDKLYTDMRMEYAELEGHKDRVECLIREIERVQAVGKNEIDRKRNASLAVQEYPGNNGQVINLYDFQRQLSERYSFLKGILDSLFGKQNRLITLNGMLKLEQGTQPYSGMTQSRGPWED